MSLSFSWLPIALLFAGACNDICDTKPEPGVAWSSGSATGSVTLQTSVGPQTGAFSVAPGGQGPSSFGGEVHDDHSGSTALIINVASSEGLWLEVDVPDVRPLQAGAALAIPAGGSLSGENGYCNITGTAALTITDARGSQLAAPQFVTGDFVRSAHVVIDTDDLVAGAYGDDPAPTCPTRFQLEGDVTLSADDYSAEYHAENCPDLSK